MLLLWWWSWNEDEKREIMGEVRRACATNNPAAVLFLMLYSNDDA